LLPLPASLVPLVRAVVEGEVRSARKVTGGYESNSFKLTTSRASYFVKWSQKGRFAQEQRGLELIRATGTIRVPNVLAARDADDGQPGFLVQEWLEPPKGDPLAQRTGAQLGEALARLHLAPAPIDGYARALEAPFGSWVDCYREGCLGPAIEDAAARGQMPPPRRASLERLIGRLEALLGDVPRKPSLLHGDFHRGNVLEAKGGELVIIDPHPWVGDREVELAQTEWQFRFPPRFYAAYEAHYPSWPGRAERRDLYLVWLALRWGGARVGQVDALLRWYVGASSTVAVGRPDHA
jgi:fructosamine-3-kinase